MKYMNWIKQVVAVCALYFSIATVASASGASGTIVHLYISATYGDLIYVQLSNALAPGVPCANGKPPYYYVLPRANAATSDMWALLLDAKKTGKLVGVIGTGTCSVDFGVETINEVTYEP